MFTELFEHIRKYVSLSKEDERFMTALLRHQKVLKKGHILTSGQVCEANYFVLKGCLRMYLVTEEGTEQIIQFAIDQWWISDYSSLYTRKPASYYIQAIEDTDLAVLDQHVTEALFDQIPSLERYFRIITQRAYAAYQKRIEYIHCMSGKERYLHFSQTVPDFVKRIPQYMLASYLGFTPEFLSKIRAQKD